MKRITTKKEFERELEEAGDRLVAVDFTAACPAFKFERELEEAGDRLVAVDFTAAWCTRHTKIDEQLNRVMYKPEFSEVLFIQVDVDDNEDTPPSCNIDFLPTVQFYRDGRKVAELYEDTIDDLQAVLKLHR